MKVAIIIPTFNRASLITRAVESVTKQSSSQWELIIVDDGSTDNTREIVTPFLSAQVRYVWQKNAGANSARNHGARLTMLDWIAFLDSDDELSPLWVDKFSRRFHDADVVCCGTLRIENSQETPVLPKSLGIVFNHEVGKFSNGASYAMKRCVFWSVGGFDEELRSGQHTELSFRLSQAIVKKEIKVVSLMEPLVSIHIHDGPRIRTSSTSKMQGALHIMKKHDPLMKQYPKLRRTYARIATFQAYNKRAYAVMLRAGFQYLMSSIRVMFSR